MIALDRMRITSSRFAVTVAAMVAAFHQESLACAVCFDGNDETRVAFILTTVFLTILPLCLIGFLIWWIRYQWRKDESAAAPAADSARSRT